MKRVTLIMGALALVLGLSQCRKPNAPTINGGNGTQHVVLQASLDNGGSKIAEDGNGGIEWEDGENADQIVVKQGTTELGTLTCTDAESGIFEGTITSTSGDITFTFGGQNFQNQTGTLNDAIRLSSGDVAYNPEGSYTNVAMTMPHAVLKLDLSAFGTATPGTAVTISAGGSEVASVTGVTNAADNPYYVAMPADGTGKTYTITGNSYGCEKSWTLAANTFYTKDGGGKDGTGAAIAVDPEWIDFGETGLPKFALKNLGATCSTTNPTDPTTATTWYGDYYAWGETAPYVTLTWSDYKTVATMTWCAHPSHNSGITFDNSVGYKWKNYLDGTQTSWNISYEWNPTPYDGTTKVLTSDYDAAHYVLHGSWRMPTGGASGEWQQLNDNTLFVWAASYRGISGLDGYVVYKVKAAAHKAQRVTTTGQSGYTGYSGFTYALTDPHMFLPAAGGFDGASLDLAGSGGLYWSSSLYSDNPRYAWSVYFNSGDVFPKSGSTRCNGLAVRPVQ